MKLYYERELLYLETEASVVHLGAALLQERKGMNCPWNEAPEYTPLHFIAFARKSLSSAGSRYINIKREGLGNLSGLEKIIITICPWSQCNYRSQIIGNYIPKQCSNTVAATTMHPTMYISIQNMHIIQAWTRALLCKLAVTTKPLCRTKKRNFWHAPKHQFHRNLHRHPRMHVNTRNMRYNTIWQTLLSADFIHNKWLAINKSRVKTRHRTILDSLGWHGSNRWNSAKRQKNSDTYFAPTAGFRTAPQQPYQNRKDISVSV